MNEWQTPESEIERELSGQERTLWAGRPRQGIVFRPSDAFMIPFSLLWGGFAIFWEATAIVSGAPFFFTLWGIPFVLVGLYFIFGRFLVDAKQRERTFYGVTNQRIVIVSGITSRKVKSLNLRTLSDVSLTEKHDRSGTITFGPANPMYAWWGGTAWPGMPQPARTFEMIPEAKGVYELIRDAQSVHL
jgi:hypothetical protein